MTDRATKRRSEEATQGMQEKTVRACPWSLRRSVAPSLSSTAFSLTELLIVIAIIVLALGAAVAAFNYLTGARSIAAGENIAGGMLARARAMAINEQNFIGVLFYHHPGTNRARMAFVTLDPTYETDPDPFDNYKGWVPDVVYRDYDPNVVPVQKADRVIFVTVDYDEPDPTLPLAERGKPMAKIYRVRDGQTHNSAPANAPPAAGPDADGLFRNQWWEEYLPGNLHLVEDTDVQVLPRGVNVQLIRNAPPGQRHYEETGMLLFDPQGRQVSMQYWIGDDLAAELGISPTQPPLPFSEFGFVVYEREALAARNPSEFPDDDAWLHENTTPILINRYSGTLMRSE